MNFLGGFIHFCRSPLLLKYSTYDECWGNIIMSTAMLLVFIVTGDAEIIYKKGVYYDIYGPVKTTYYPPPPRGSPGLTIRTADKQYFHSSCIGLHEYLCKEPKIKHFSAEYRFRYIPYERSSGLIIAVYKGEEEVFANQKIRRFFFARNLETFIVGCMKLFALWLFVMSIIRLRILRRERIAKGMRI